MSFEVVDAFPAFDENERIAAYFFLRGKIGVKITGKGIAYATVFGKHVGDIFLDDADKFVAESGFEFRCGNNKNHGIFLCLVLSCHTIYASWNICNFIINLPDKNLQLRGRQFSEG